MTSCFFFVSPNLTQMAKKGMCNFRSCRSNIHVSKSSCAKQKTPHSAPPCPFSSRSMGKKRAAQASATSISLEQQAPPRECCSSSEKHHAGRRLPDQHGRKIRHLWTHRIHLRESLGALPNSYGGKTVWLRCFPGWGRNAR